MPQEHLFQFIGREFSKAEIRWLLVGGFAVNFHGVSRLTRDLDLLVTDSVYPQALAILQRIRYRECYRQEHFARLRAEHPQLMDIDVLFAEDGTFEKMWAASVVGTVAETTVRIPTLEHLVAMKLHALKYGHAGRQRKDLDDVRDLAERAGWGMDSEVFRALCHRFGDDKVYRLIKGQ